MSHFRPGAQSPAEASPTAAADAPHGRRPRVLVLRSCRPAQFAAAVDRVRRQAEVEIVALSHPGHRESLVAAGVDRIIEIPGSRFGLLRMSPSVLRRLRREGFDEVVVPQMTVHADGHANLYQLAAAIGSRQVTVLAAEDPPFIADATTFVLHAIKVTLLDALGWCQRPIFVLAMLMAASLWPRRSAQTARRRRVLHIISSLGVGGAQRQLAELVNRTPADRFDVDVLVLGRFDGEFAREWFARPDVRVSYLRQWPRLGASILEVRRHCLQGNYDIVHTWLFMANVIGVAGARLAGVPHVIASVRNLSLWKRTWYRQWWFRIADVLCSWDADVVTVNAQALTTDHAQWACYPRHWIQVVPNGLDPSLFLVDSRAARAHVRAATGLPDEAMVVGTVGRLAPEKDHLAFLRTIQMVRHAGADARGVLVGDGPLRQRLEAAAAELGIADAVTFLGERQDARRLMAGFDVFVLTSAIEGFPNVLLEAAFLNVPSVASRVGGSPDVLENPADTFAVGDAASAAQRVLALIRDPETAAAAAASTRQRALALFTADQTATRWFALYDAQRRPRLSLRAVRDLLDLRARREYKEAHS
jgi:glycosyltransferase involved in cell wall biosynthesis